MTVPGVHGAIEAAGATLLYPPCCPPELTPIEQFFANLKPLLPNGGRTVRRPPKWTRVAALLDALNPDECANYCRNAGCASRQVESALGAVHFGASAEPNFFAC